MQYQCSVIGCGRKAVIKLQLENYQIIYSCSSCEKALRRRYREAKIVRLDSKFDESGSAQKSL